MPLATLTSVFRHWRRTKGRNQLSPWNPIDKVDRDCPARSIPFKPLTQ